MLAYAAPRLIVRHNAALGEGQPAALATAAAAIFNE
jgi:hypothetical protein